MFQPFDLMTERRLGNPKPIRSLAEMKRLRYRQKIAKVAKFDFVIHIVWVSISIFQLLDI